MFCIIFQPQSICDRSFITRVQWIAYKRLFLEVCVSTVAKWALFTFVPTKDSPKFGSGHFLQNHLKNLPHSHFEYALFEPIDFTFQLVSVLMAYCPDLLIPSMFPVSCWQIFSSYSSRIFIFQRELGARIPSSNSEC